MMRSLTMSHRLSPDCPESQMSQRGYFAIVRCKNFRTKKLRTYGSPKKITVRSRFPILMNIFVVGDVVNDV